MFRRSALFSPFWGRGRGAGGLRRLSISLRAQEEGVLSNDGSLRFVALRGGGSTVISATQTSDSSKWKSQAVAGSFGIPMMTQRSGRRHVPRRQHVRPSEHGLLRDDQFKLINTQDLATRDSIARGTFAFDALSPRFEALSDQHRSNQDIQHYTVRATPEGARLLPGRIADKTQKGWVMQGWPVPARRATRAAGCTLANPGGVPFIHARHGEGCRALHRHSLARNRPHQSPLFSYTLSLAGKKLAVKLNDGTTYRFVNLANWKVSKKG
jgi:hypothetical protein